MKIARMVLKYNGVTKSINFEQKTLIFSKDNSVGKSTLLRLLFYSLGYQIPGTYELKFKDVQTETTFIRDDKEYTVKRNDKYIELFGENNFISSATLSEYSSSWLAQIWGLDNIRVLRNILGAVYMDQDKGWTLLNRGKVIGNIRFNIRDLLIGLSSNNADLDSSLSKLDKQKRMLSQTRQLLNLEKTTSTFNELDSGTLNDDEDPKLDRAYKNLKLELRVAENELSDVKKSLKQEEGVRSYLLSLHLMIKVNGDIVLVNKDNILNYNDNIEFLRQKSAIIQEDIEKLKFRIERVKQRIEENTSSLFQEDDVVQRTLRNIAEIDMNVSVLEAREMELTRAVTDLNNDIEAAFVKNNELISETRQWILTFAKRLGIEEVVSGKKYIFTRDLKSISGTIYYKVVFSFKMAYIKIIEKYTGLELPIVLDSPSGREVTDRNIADVIDILNDYFEPNQVIIASINKYDLNGVRTLELTKRIFETDFGYETTEDSKTDSENMEHR